MATLHVVPAAINYIAWKQIGNVVRDRVMEIYGFRSIWDANIYRLKVALERGSSIIAEYVFFHDANVHVGGCEIIRCLCRVT